MATVDSLDIRIEGSAQKANDAIDGLIVNLGRLANSLNIDTSSLSNIGKSMNFGGISGAAKTMQSQAQKVTKTLAQMTEQYKELGKGFEIKGSTQQIQKQIDSLTNKLANAKLAKDDFEKSGKTNLGGYETAVKNVIKYTNQIESLKKQLSGMNEVQPKLDFNVTGAESATKYLIEYKKQLMDFKNDMKSMSDVYGGFQNVPKGGLDTPIQNLKQSIEELKQSYPQATNVISAFEKELQKLQNISAGLTKEPTKINFDTNSIDRINEKIRELKSRFEKAGSDFKFTGNFEQLNIEIEKVYSKLNELKAKEQEMISAGQINTSGFEQLQESLARVGNKFGIMQDLKYRTEAFNQSLQQLRVPEIREENLKKLQSTLKKTEENTEKLRTKLSNAITMGKIVPNIDDSGFRKLTEQIALSEKQAEALRQKIQEVGGDTSGTGSFMDRLKTALSSVSSQSNKTSSATNILSKNIKNLSSSMSGFSASAGKAITGMKSFARQALSAIGIYLGVYGAVRGLKSSIESSMNYIEILNYFNAAFGQVAEKADLSSFEEMGYDSAESYYNSFSERAKELTEKMSGFTIKESGMLETGGMKSLGIDPSQLMNYQAMFGQMSSSMGVTSENALRLSTVLTEIGADLASVKNMKFEKVWNDMASGLAGMSRTLDKYGANIRNVNLQQKLNELGISANISALNQNDKALLRTIILLDSTRYAWGDLAKTINQPANQLRLLQSNFSNLGRAIGNIFLPIVAKILPYINMLVQALSRLAEWLVKLLGFEEFNWGGGGGGNAPDILGDVYDNAEDASGALDKVSSSAKKAKAGLRGFDELKTINMPDSGEPDEGTGSPGSGTGGIDSGILQGALDSILDEYQKAWDKAFSEMEERANTFADNVAKAFKEKGLYGVGEYFSESITDALNSIQWDSVYEGARNFGKGLADFLNGLISPELFYSLGKTVAGAIGAVLHFLDSFADPENGFDFTNFGNSLASGVAGVLENIPWETALSAASNWGIGIAKTLNAFISPETFGLIGESIAKALNVTVQFALDFGHEFKFKNLGNSIAEGINRFFLEFKPEKLAETINVWIKGALDTVTALLQKTDFEEIGKKIGTFLAELDFLEIAGKFATALWEAIKAGFELLGGLIQEAPLETALIAVFGVLKFTGIGKLIAGNIATSISQSLATALGSISLPSLPVIAAIAAVVAALVDLWNTSESFRKIVVSAFAMVKDSLVGAFNKIKDAVAPLWDKVKELGKAFYDFYESSHLKDLVEILAKVYTVAYSIAASTVFTVLGNMISGFATMVGGAIDIIKGLVEVLTSIFTLDGEGIVQGFSDIFGGVGDSIGGFFGQFGIDLETEQVESEVEMIKGFGQALHDSLIMPGGVPINELTDTVIESIDGIGDEFSSLSEKSNELDNAEKNIEDIKSQIQLVEEELKAGTITSEEAKSRLTALLDELNTAAQEKFGSLNGYIVSAFGEGGIWAKSFEDAGIDVSDMVGKTLGLTSELQTRFSEITAELSTLDPTSPKYKELQEEMYGIIGQTDSLETALTNFDTKISSINVDYSGLLTEEGELDTEAVENSMNSISTAVNDANAEIDSAGLEMKETLTELMNAAKAEGNQEAVDYYGNLLKQLPKVIKEQKEAVAERGKELTDELQSMKTKTEKIAKEVPAGMEEGVTKNTGIAFKAVGDMAGKMLKEAKEKLGIHSPSTKFKEIGGYIVEGMKGGISGKWIGFSEFWKEKYDSVIGTFKNIENSFNGKGKDAVTGLKGGIGEKWGDFISDWGEKKNKVVGKYDSIKSDMDKKGVNIVSGLQGGISSKWKTFNQDWTQKKNGVVSKFDGIKGTFEGKGSDIVSGLEGGIGSKWDGFVKGLEDKIKSMVNGIIHGINWVLEKLSVPESKWLKDWEGFATGSNGLPQDTIGIVNDQKGSVYKELIVPPHGKPFIPEGRNVMLPMKKGTKIMPARQTKDFMQKMNGMPHFAGGIGDFFKGAWAKITKFTGNVWDYMKNPGKLLQIAFDKFTDLSGMLEPVLSIAKGAASTLLDGATNFIKKIFDENLTVEYNPSKGVEQWRGLATKALQMTGQFSETNLNALLYRMNMESSGNPKAINLWDANAKRGTPSKGLMQVIDPTFESYAMPGFDKDIWDPLSNILASIRYTLATYKGSLTAGWLKSGGYAKGIGKINLGDLIPQYRAGGFPKQYSLFMAGEHGRAEMLGTVGGKTAVAGGAEITGIVSAVNSASATEAQLLREQNDLLRALLKKEFGITKRQIGEAAQDYSREYLRTKGIPAYAF